MLAEVQGRPADCYRMLCSLGQNSLLNTSSQVCIVMITLINRHRGKQSPKPTQSRARLQYSGAQPMRWGVGWRGLTCVAASSLSP